MLEAVALRTLLLCLTASALLQQCRLHYILLQPLLQPQLHMVAGELFSNGAADGGVLGHSTRADEVRTSPHCCANPGTSQTHLGPHLALSLSPTLI